MLEKIKILISLCEILETNLKKCVLMSLKTTPNKKK